MDRRQKKTRTAIINSFIKLLSKKQYYKITIQEVIDEADVGRSTFYAHFETKEDLLHTLCQELFHHILENTAGHSGSGGRYSDEEAPKSMFCHILHHLQKNDNNVLTLLASENNDIFLEYFKRGLNEIVQTQILSKIIVEESGLPEDFIVSHISGSFVEMLRWWIKNGRKQTPEELDEYFQAILPHWIKEIDG